MATYKLSKEYSTVRGEARPFVVSLFVFLYVLLLSVPPIHNKISIELQFEGLYSRVLTQKQDDSPEIKTKSEEPMESLLSLLPFHYSEKVNSLIEKVTDSMFNQLSSHSYVSRLKIVNSFWVIWLTYLKCYIKNVLEEELKYINHFEQHNPQMFSKLLEEMLKNWETRLLNVSTIFNDIIKFELCYVNNNMDLSDHDYYSMSIIFERYLDVEMDYEPPYLEQNETEQSEMEENMDKKKRQDNVIETNKKGTNEKNKRLQRLFRRIKNYLFMNN